jgi:signal transduction histidine kinase
MAIFLSGVLLFFAAPWLVRVLVYLDRLLMRALLGPDPVSLRVRTLEQARTQTVDASAATLRRIERDLHDGTQAQLVALAMRLGQAKEKLEDGDHLDIEQVRKLVTDAHSGAKEAIVELRDLARGIHPPALDIGLEGALSTLAARSTVPTELSLSFFDRPTPAIEAITYFCAAELLANIAQHANASRASVTCAQHGRWLRLVVRDDGTGGAQLARAGSSSSGLSGLTDRVHAIDGRLDIVSPPRGPTVVTIDLPLQA